MTSCRITESGDYFVGAEPPEGDSRKVTITTFRPDGTTLYVSKWLEEMPPLPGMPDGLATRDIIFTVPADAMVSTDLDNARLVIRRRGGGFIFDSAQVVPKLRTVTPP